MCGFLGEFLFKGQYQTPTVEFDLLLKLSNHRGPDTTSTKTKSNFQLGFNRLAVQDVSEKGNQPMTSVSGRYQIVFNGEIYNFRQLQENYKISDLQSTSDTEVLVQLIDKIGVKSTLKVLNGMFAIAIIDIQTNELYLTRDFAGIKPHFYGISDKGIVFASQFNQVFKHPFFKDNLNLRKEIVKEYFGLGYMQAPNTIYQNIYQVNPGELIKITSDGLVTKSSITKFDSEFNNLNQESDLNSVESFKKQFNAIVKNQMVCDVPLATFLSGGIDSPLVTAVAKDQQDSIEAFTMGVDHKKYDESEKAIEYATHIKVKHTIENVSAHNLLENIDTHFKYMSEPFGDYSSIPTFLICQKARKKHTVMLSGDGGDELFFGYPRMSDILKKRNWFKIPHTIRKPLVRIAIKLKLFNSWAPYTYNKLGDWVLGKQLHVSLQKLNAIVPNTTFSKELLDLYKIPTEETQKSLLHWLRFNEFYGHLQRVLIKVDRMSMANSLEVRVPFLDKKNIEFSWSRLPKIKNNDFGLKQLLKNVMEHYYPVSIIEKEKKGFSVPMEDWLHNELKSDLIKVIFETPFYGEEMIDVVAVKKYVSDYLDNKHLETWGVWHVYAWQKWALAEGLV